MKEGGRVDEKDGAPVARQPSRGNLKFARSEELLGGVRIKERYHDGSEESGYCCGPLIKA